MAIKFLNNVNTESNQPLYELTNSEQKFWNAEDAIAGINFNVEDSSNPAVSGLVDAFISRVSADGGTTESPQCIETKLNPLVADPQGSALTSGAKTAAFVRPVSDESSLTPSGALAFGVSRGGGNSTDAVESMRLTGDGSLAVGKKTASYKLDVEGTIRASGDVIAYSDSRVKENVESISNALDKVKSMRGVGYNKIGEEKRSIGVIAQEVLEVLPEVVHQDDQGMYSVAYGNIVGVLIEAVKEQQIEIEKLKSMVYGTAK